METTTQPEIEIDLSRLAKMDARRLQARHREMFGAEHPVTNAGHLRRKIAWHLQARKHGGVPDSTVRHALAIARSAELRVRISDSAARKKKGIRPDRTATTAIVPPYDARLPLAGACW